jgi:5-methylcytosine-specific restriction endonuclease McrA
MPWRQPTFRPRWMPRQKRFDEARPNSSARGYGSQAWQRVRRLVIARDNGICQICGLLVPPGPGEAHIDHIERKPQDEAAEATPLEGLRLLCRSCHSRVTSSGAWSSGRPPRD